MIFYTKLEQYSCDKLIETYRIIRLSTSDYVGPPKIFKSIS